MNRNKYVDLLESKMINSASYDKRKEDIEANKSPTQLIS